MSVSLSKNGADHAAVREAATSMSIYSFFVLHLEVGFCFLSSSEAETVLLLLWGFLLFDCFTNTYADVEWSLNPVPHLLSIH